MTTTWDVRSYFIKSVLEAVTGGLLEGDPGKIESLARSVNEYAYRSACSDLDAKISAGEITSEEQAHEYHGKRMGAYICEWLDRNLPR